MPIIISKEGSKAVRVEQTSFAQEIELQLYIEAHPEAIPLDDIKENVEFLILDREFPVSVGSIDALGVDSDGDIYIIETKLYKNADKRKVVAQVLDYGAALWTKNENPNDWIDKIERRMSGKGLELREHLEEKFGQSDDTIEGMVANLPAGAFKFIVLMDQVPSALKDLILYINQNSSFSVYGVELEYYVHGDLKILKPQIFGTETKRKSVSGPGSPRKSWDEISFFEELDLRVKKKEFAAIQKIYEFSEQIGDEMVWGTGAIRGTFNPRINELSTKTIYGVKTDGTLSFHHTWMYEDQRLDKWREEFARRLKAIQPILRIFSQRGTENADIPPEVWTPVVDEIIEAIRESIKDYIES